MAKPDHDALPVRGVVVGAAAAGEPLSPGDVAAPIALTSPADAVGAETGAATADEVGVEVAAAAANVPVSRHEPVNPLNGPPTMRLFHSSTKAPVRALYVPVGPLVPPGREPSGFGEPWLKCWLFHDAANARRSPVSRPPSSLTVGRLTRAPVWGSVWFVAVEKLTPKNRWGFVSRLARAPPVVSNAGSGLGC
jgi:hypothetical protein